MLQKEYLVSEIAVVISMVVEIFGGMGERTWQKTGYLQIAPTLLTSLTCLASHTNPCYSLPTVTSLFPLPPHSASMFYPVYNEVSLKHGTWNRINATQMASGCAVICRRMALYTDAATRTQGSNSPGSRSIIRAHLATAETYADM